MSIKLARLGCILIAVFFNRIAVPRNQAIRWRKRLSKKITPIGSWVLKGDDVEVRKIDWGEYNDALKIWEAEVTVYAFPSSLIQRRVEHVTEFTFQYDYNAKRWRGNKGKNLR